MSSKVRMRMNIAQYESYHLANFQENLKSTERDFLNISRDKPIDHFERNLERITARMLRPRILQPADLSPLGYLDRNWIIPVTEDELAPS